MLEKMLLIRVLHRTAKRLHACVYAEYATTKKAIIGDEIPVGSKRVANAKFIRFR